MFSVIFLSIVIDMFFGVVVAFYSWIFRRIIKNNALNGMTPCDAEQFIKTQSFAKQLLMTYIIKCNPTGKQRLGLAIWFLICHYIHVISFLTHVIMGIVEIFYEVLWNHTISGGTYIIGNLTYGRFLDFVLYILIWSLPASLVIGILLSLLSKKKLEKTSVPYPSSKWEMAVERLFYFLLGIVFPDSIKKQPKDTEKNPQNLENKPQNTEKRQ